MDTSQSAPKKLEIALYRNRAPESLFRPNYKKWAMQIWSGKPLRVTTTRDRSICFIPSVSFPDNGGMLEGTLIVCYGGIRHHGYIELDFTKQPNPFFLQQKGFPIELGVLICRTIYEMFPHLNPLKEEDYNCLKEQTKKSPKTTKAIRLTHKEPKKPRIRAKKVSKEEEPPTAETAPIEVVPLDEILPDNLTPQTEKQDHGNRKTKQRKARNKAGTNEASPERPPETELPPIPG